jgi:hypothetical protein
MDATILRADGSRIVVGDALYHPENLQTAEAIVTLVNATPAFEELIEAAQAIQNHAFTISEMTLSDGEPVIGLPDSDYGALCAALEALAKALGGDK